MTVSFDTCVAPPSQPLIIPKPMTRAANIRSLNTDAQLRAIRYSFIGMFLSQFEIEKTADS